MVSGSLQPASTNRDYHARERGAPRNIGQREASSVAAVARYGLMHHDPTGIDYLHIQARKRYEFALDWVKAGDRVLDIGSGSGYGSALLQRAGCRVVGVDADARASKTLLGDALQLPFRDSSFDVVTTFETIEHVSDGERFLLELLRVLRPGGTFIGSTPNIQYTNHPDFHIREYGSEEFYRLVGRLLPGAERFAQYFRLPDRVWSLIQRKTWHLAEGVRRIGLEKLLVRSITAPEDYYRVRLLNGSRGLRIMVVAGKKS